MTCCGNCGGGSRCNCGRGCSGCNSQPEMVHEKSSTMVLGLGTQKETTSAGTEGCKCGSSCSCNPCRC